MTKTSADPVEISRFKLPTDGRKWQSVCDERHRIVAHIAAGGECTRDALGLPQRTFERRMAELRQLGLVANLQLDTARFTRPPDSRSDATPDSVTVAPGPPDAPPDSESDRQIQVPDSANVAEDRQIEVECGGKPPDSPPDSITKPETRSSHSETRSYENETRSYERQNPLMVSDEPTSINLQIEPTRITTTPNPPNPPNPPYTEAPPDSPSTPLPPTPKAEEEGGGNSLGLRPCAQGKSSEAPPRNENLALNTDLTRSNENLEGGGGYSNGCGYGGKKSNPLTPSASPTPSTTLNASPSTKTFAADLMEVYANAGLGALNLAGLKKVKTLEGNREEKLRVFGHWLATRPQGMRGLNYPLAMFATEYPGYYDAIKRYEKRKAAKAANQKKVAESQAAAEQWRVNLGAIKYEGEPETWVQQVKDWMVANPCPDYLVVTEDGELARIDWAGHLVSLAIAVAEDRAEKARLRKHIEGYEFCCCERCKPEYWAKADKEAHDCQCPYADCPGHYSGMCLEPAHHHHPGFPGEAWVCGECAAEFVRRASA